MSLANKCIFVSNFDNIKSENGFKQIIELPNGNVNVSSNNNQNRLTICSRIRHSGSTSDDGNCDNNNNSNE